ncbi:MAG: peptide-methionine (S)-S-oxide reductase MsrA, partial [Yaniella sp.]|nr:peptide-methionine (S)-S-oxide reductase MsrA [Yaniella sp.]
MSEPHIAQENSNLKTLIVGGGCFWCQDAVYRQTKGVVESESGYIGGHIDHPTYEQITTGQTGHAEAVKVTFDQDIIDADTILDMLFASHDPTSLNRQGADVGPQYRSALFPQSVEDRQLFEDAIERHQQFWSEPIVTTIEENQQWWPAEQEHQNFYQRN